MLLADHLHRIRQHVEWMHSLITIFVESNLGYESEHHERSMRGLYKVRYPFPTAPPLVYSGNTRERDTAGRGRCSFTWTTREEGSG